MIAAAWLFAILATCCAAFVAVALNSGAADPRGLRSDTQTQRRARGSVWLPRGSIVDISA